METLFYCMKDQLGGAKTQLRPLYISCWPVHILPHPPTFLPVLYVERAIYTESWGAISEYTVLTSPGFVTHWFSPHHHHGHQLKHHLPSSSYLRETEVDPVFSWVLWLPIVVFQHSLEHLMLGTPLTWSNLPPAQHENQLIRAGKSLKAPPWASLVLSAFSRILRGPASCLTVLRTIWSE